MNARDARALAEQGLTIAVSDELHKIYDTIKERAHAGHFDIIPVRISGAAMRVLGDQGYTIQTVRTERGTFWKVKW